MGFNSVFKGLNPQQFCP